MFLYSDYDDNIGNDQYEEGAHRDESTVGCDHEFQFMGVCAGKFDEPGKVTIEAIQHIWSTERQIDYKSQLNKRVCKANYPGS